ncbi:MAG: hypothetical protein ABW133_20615 [Polyangiaceae bacterium]
MNRSVPFIMAFALAACGNKLDAVVAPTSDYADYRETRIAPTVPERLRAAARYLNERPDGAFRGPVSAWFAKVEPVFFEANSDSLAGAEKYLATLPQGPHANQAEQLRDAFRAQARIDSGERIAERGAEFEKRLAAAAQARDDVLSAYTAWVGRVLDFETWGKPIESAKEPFSSAWNAEPKAKCKADACTKMLSLPYELQIAGKPEKFVCILEISTRLTKGRITEITIAGPALFARLAEARSARPTGNDEASRSRAISSIVELTEGAAEKRLPRSRCTSDGAPRTPFVRECDGWKLEVYPATGDGEGEAEDRVVIRGPAAL